MEGAKLFRATDAGIEALGGYDPIPTGLELIEHWKSVPRGGLGKAACLIIDLLVAEHPDKLTKIQIAEGTGYSPTSGGLSNSISELRTRNLIVSDDGHTGINPDIFR